MAEFDIQANLPPESTPSGPALPAAATVDVQRPSNAMTTIVPYTNPKALLSYYCGVFALIPLVGALLGPVALLLGILGLRRVRRYPQAKGTGHAIMGMVLGLLTLLLNWGPILYIWWGLNYDDTIQRIWQELQV